MDESDILDKLGEIIKKMFRNNKIIVTAKTVASDVDGWDSLSHALLILRIEKAFDVKFHDAEIGEVQSVGDLVQTIKRMKENAA